MAFEDALEEMSRRVSDLRAELATEEATKTAIIMPFIGRVLGYDVFNPKEVVPEFVCDVGIKKGEKIDFAIMRGGQVQLLIEAKKIGESLGLEHAGQLVRYFHVSKARIAALTNGQYWDFYADLDRPNVMDERPFLHFEELRYVSSIKREIGAMFAEVPDDLLRLLISRVYSGAITTRVKDLFSGIAKKALTQFINEQVNDRLKTALQGQAPAVGAAPLVVVPGPDAAEYVPESDAPGLGVVTTEEEEEAFRIVRAIVVSEVGYPRVVMRDQKSYCSVLLDDNNRKPVCRLHFNRAQKYLGLFDEQKVETRVALTEIEEIYAHAEPLRAAVRRYR